MMKSSCFLLACFISLVVVPCVGAEMGMVTLVDGKPRLLRGTAWFTLSEGVRIRDGDTIDLPEKGQLQIELTDGGAVSAIGPGALYAASLTPRDGKQPPLAEFFLPRGWLKLDAKAPGTRLRIRSPASTVMASDAVAVMHATGDNVDMFVETGSVKMTDPAPGRKPRAADMSLAPRASPPSPLRALRPRLWARCRATSWTRCPSAPRNSHRRGRTRLPTARRRFPRRSLGSPARIAPRS